MCGIIGQFSSRLSNRNDFEAALKLLSHRGPDGQGIVEGQGYLLGHKRLSIIDLLQRSSQPLHSQEPQGDLVFNGEIYNYIELRNELKLKGCTFTTTGDSEVLLKGFLLEGIEFVKKCIGMFSACIVNYKEKKAYIFRDRLGIKPLYYSFHNQQFLFASEVKAILKLSSHLHQLDLGSVNHYLAYRYPIINKSFFSGIISLDTGCYIELAIENPEKFKTKRYWSLSYSYKLSNNKSQAEQLENIKKLLDSAVKLRLRSDVPVGTFLSGGVDSSILTALASNHSKHPLNTYSIGFGEGFNENEYANKVARQYNTLHHSLSLDVQEYFSTVDELIRYKDAPLAVPNEAALYILSKKLKQSVTVVLSGEGADEVFGGYGRIFSSSYDFKRLQSGLCRQTFLDNFITRYGQSSFASTLDHFIFMYDYVSMQEREKLLLDKKVLKESNEQSRALFSDLFNDVKHRSYGTQIMYAFQNIHLQGLLGRVDTASMAASVEARVPFVDHRIVEYMAGIPFAKKIPWKNKDSRDTAQSILATDFSEVFDIPKYYLKQAYKNELPDEILYRKKVGFPLPLGQWLGESFYNNAKDILLEKNSQIQNIIDKKTIKMLLENSNIRTQKKNNSLKLWMLINLELFLKEYF